VVKFLLNVGIDKCVNYIGEFNDFPGVLCSGHYGTMQFLHAQASLAPGETVRNAKPEPFDVTRQKMVGWTEFAFKVATGALPTGDPYCASVREFGVAGAALAPQSFPYCGNWTVGSLFGFKCDHPLTSSTCSRDVPEAEIRRAATGALLHMIQDSYSRSHTGRGESLPVGPYKNPGPQVRCQPVQEFYRYTLEQKKAHSKADKVPTFLPECTRSDTMDPITASARIIWLVDNGCDASWAKDVVAEGVIGNRNTAPPTSVAECRVAKA
jgi:hypothetical protein